MGSIFYFGGYTNIVVKLYLGAGPKYIWGSNLFYFGCPKNWGAIFLFLWYKKMGSNFYIWSPKNWGSSFFIFGVPKNSGPILFWG